MNDEKKLMLEHSKALWKEHEILQGGDHRNHVLWKILAEELQGLIEHYCGEKE